MLFLPLIFLCCSWASSGFRIPPNARSVSRIVGGYPINITDVPYQVSLQTKTGEHFCGGSIISSKYILTAAHCTDLIKKQFSIRIGSSMASDGGQIFLVKNVIQHPNFNDDFIDYDYSLLELESELEFDESVNSIQIPTKADPPAVGSRCIVSGWGSDAMGGNSSEILMGLNLRIIDWKKCNMVYKGFLTPRMLCAGVNENGKSACQGDSGGPLVCEGTLVGVVSFARGCGFRYYPGVYADVAYVMDWIQFETGI